jgi:hypothetical protein
MSSACLEFLPQVPFTLNVVSWFRNERPPDGNESETPAIHIGQEGCGGFESVKIGQLRK